MLHVLEWTREGINKIYPRNAACGIIIKNNLYTFALKRCTLIGENLCLNGRMISKVTLHICNMNPIIQNDLIFFSAMAYGDASDLEWKHSSIYVVADHFR